MRWFIAQHPWPNSAMYHYTSRLALENIVATRKMWATDLRMMNDPRELRHGRELLEQRIKVMIRKGANELKATFLRTTYKQYRLLMASRSTAFSISFSNRADLPHQWWNYAAAGAGFALEWSIDDDCPEIPLRMWFTYDKPKQKALIDGLIACHLNWIGDVVSQEARTPLDAISEAGISLAKFIDVTVHTFKSAKWSPETEFRFVYRFFEGYLPSNVTIKTRPAGNFEKKYIEADFRAVELRRILVGPRNDLKSTTTWLRSFLDANGFPQTTIMPSPVAASDLSVFE